MALDLTTINDKLNGNATPYPGVNNAWFLNGLLLVKKNSDLRIFDGSTPLSEINSPATPSVTLPNYPFGQNGPAHGFTLGQVPTGETAASAVQTGIIGGPLLATDNKDGVFVGYTNFDIGEEVVVPRMVEYDAKGAPLGDLPLGNPQPNYEVDYPLQLPNGKVLLPNHSFNQNVGVAALDPRTGEITPTTLFDEAGVENGQSFIVGPVGPGTISSAGGKYYLQSQRRVGTKVERRIQEFDPNTLAKIGEPIIAAPGQDLSAYGSLTAVPGPSSPKIKLGNGVEVSRNGRTLNIETPLYRPMTADEIPPVFVVQPNADFIVPDGVKNARIIFEQPIAGQLGQGSASIPNNNGQFEIIGDGNVDLSELGVDKKTLTDSVKPGSPTIIIAGGPQLNFPNLSPSDLLGKINNGTLFSGLTGPTISTTPGAKTSTTFLDPTQPTSSSTEIKAITASPTTTTGTKEDQNISSTTAGVSSTTTSDKQVAESSTTATGTKRPADTSTTTKRIKETPTFSPTSVNPTPAPNFTTLAPQINSTARPTRSSDPVGAGGSGPFYVLGTAGFSVLVAAAAAAAIAAGYVVYRKWNNGASVDLDPIDEYPRDVPTATGTIRMERVNATTDSNCPPGGGTYIRSTIIGTNLTSDDVPTYSSTQPPRRSPRMPRKTSSANPLVPGDNQQDGNIV